MAVGSLRGGAIISTPSDRARFITAVFEGPLLSPVSRTDMLTSVSKELPGSEKGIVVLTLTDRNRTAYQHLGGIDAFNRSLTYLPDVKVAIAITFNKDHDPSRGLRTHRPASGQDPFSLRHPPSGNLIEFRKTPPAEGYSNFVLYQGRSQMRFRRE